MKLLLFLCFLLTPSLNTFQDRMRAYYRDIHPDSKFLESNAMPTTLTTLMKSSADSTVSFVYYQCKNDIGYVGILNNFFFKKDNYNGEKHLSIYFSKYDKVLLFNNTMKEDVLYNDVVSFKNLMMNQGLIWVYSFDKEHKFKGSIKIFPKASKLRPEIVQCSERNDLYYERVAEVSGDIFSENFFSDNPDVLICNFQKIFQKEKLLNWSDWKRRSNPEENFFISKWGK